MKVVPGYLYSKDFPGGKRFEIEEEYYQAITDGWSETPTNLEPKKNTLSSEPPKAVGAKKKGEDK